MFQSCLKIEKPVLVLFSTFIIDQRNPIGEVFMVQNNGPFYEPHKRIEPLERNKKFTQQQVKSVPLSQMGKFVIEDISIMTAREIFCWNNGIWEK